MFSELNDPARQPSVYASLPSLARSQARLEAGMDSLLLFRRALSSPTMCRFIPALSVTGFCLISLGFSTALSLLGPHCFSSLTRLVSGCVISSQGHQPALLKRLGESPVRFCGQTDSVSEKSLFARTNRNMQPKIHRSATTYSVQKSISDTLSVCPAFLLSCFSLVLLFSPAFLIFPALDRLRLTKLHRYYT